MGDWGQLVDALTGEFYLLSRQSSGSSVLKRDLLPNCVGCTFQHLIGVQLRWQGGEKHRWEYFVLFCSLWLFSAHLCWETFPPTFSCYSYWRGMQMQSHSSLSWELLPQNLCFSGLRWEEAQWDFLGKLPTFGLVQVKSSFEWTCFYCKWLNFEVVWLWNFIFIKKHVVWLLWFFYSDRMQLLQWMRLFWILTKWII